MRKILLIFLVLSAMGIYIYDILLLVHPQKAVTPAKEPAVVVSLDKLLAEAKPVEFVVNGRDPFSPRKLDPKLTNTTSLSKSDVAHPAVDPKLPTISISGIMWNPASPIAMLNLPDGSSVVAKPGQIFGDITVGKIEKNRVQIVFNKKAYWISQ